MQTPSKAIARRLTPVVAAVAMAFVASALPAGPGLPGVPMRVADAADPAPSPSPSPSPSPAVSPELTPAPTPDASTTPTPDVTPAPTQTAATTPDPTAPPSANPPMPPSTGPSEAPTPSPTDNPSPGVAPSATPTPAPTPTPTPIPYKLSPGQQTGHGVSKAIPIYRLRTVVSAASSTSPHTGYTLDSPDCALCHSAHDAQAPALMAGTSQAAVCYSCHSASGAASTDVQTQFQVPANDESTDSYYSHPVTDASSSLHVLAGDDTFAGVENRHAVCADCHNPHNATSTRPVQTTTGWTVPGNTKGASAVAATNGAGGSNPTYALLPGGSATYEYQLCLKCHSGYTVLPTRSSSSPSWWALDAGVEFNPANNSVHPIEARGRNLTTEMAGSLAGTSPFKAWNYSIDSTLRCTSCHGDPSTVNQTASGTPKTPDPASAEAAHGSPNRGLLIAPYRDRTLMAAGDAYNSANFALCYLCHAERPFVDTNASASEPDTNFPYHGAHMQDISGGQGLGNSIDTPGAGDGLALCAECHFRVHSTAIAYQIGDLTPTARTTGSQSLVDFAPNVKGVLTFAPTWTQPGSSGVGSCTLTCHGYQHTSSNTHYTVAPAAGFSADITSGRVGASGLAVQFTDASRYISASNGTWSWDFGDGGTSSLQSPSHTYTTTGTYTVTLTLTRSGGLSSTLTRTGYITVTP